MVLPSIRSSFNSLSCPSQTHHPHSPTSHDPTDCFLKNQDAPPISKIPLCLSEQCFISSTKVRSELMPIALTMKPPFHHWHKNDLDKKKNIILIKSYTHPMYSPSFSFCISQHSWAWVLWIWNWHREMQSVCLVFFPIVRHWDVNGVVMLLPSCVHTPAAEQDGWETY